MWYYGHMMGWGDSGWSAVHMIFWLVILIAIVAGVFWLVRPDFYRRASRADSTRQPSALDILEERYARGEINRDEYLEKKRDLSDSA